MARLSQILKDNETSKNIPDNYIKDLSTCLFCGDKIQVGGCWAGTYHIGVCSACSNHLIDLLIDTLEDTEHFEKLTLEEKKRYLNNICENRLLKKETFKR